MFGEESHYQISHSYLFKKYKELLKVNEEEYKNTIRARSDFGTICFDHQTLKPLNGKFTKHENRLAIVWYAGGKYRLLSTEKILDKSGLEQCRSILRNCNEFQIDDKQIVAFACDNAAPNIGTGSGTCIRIEDIFEKPILRLVCRHHVMEIMLKDVYHHFFKTSAPTNEFYPLLKESWSFLSENRFPFEPCCDDIVGEFLDVHLTQDQIDTYYHFKEIALNELRSHANNTFIRDDYKEITNLSRRYFGDFDSIAQKPNAVLFYALQNPSNARFMGISINALKCYLFREQLDWNTEEREKIKENLPWFAAFIALIYNRYWNRTSILFDAPVNDLNLLNDLESYAFFDQATATIAINALCRHLNYLGQELVVLSLFSKKLTIDEKKQIASKLKEFTAHPLPQRDTNLNHIQFVDEIDNWRSVKLVDLIGERSPYMFQLMELQTSFLDLDASEWETNQCYLMAKNTIENALICVNDCTERAISKCKWKNRRQRCRNKVSFRRNMIQSYE